MEHETDTVMELAVPGHYSAEDSLVRIEAQLDEIISFVNDLKALAESMKNNPMLSMMLPPGM